jgi:SOS-response transcriptional repressor LexA
MSTTETMTAVTPGWIAEAFKRTGKTKVGLAGSLGIHASQMSRILRGDRRLRVDEIPAIVGYFQEEDEHDELDLRHEEAEDLHDDPIMVVGEVAAGVWIQVDDTDLQYDQSPFPADPRFPAEAQYDLVVRGTSINRFAQPGERLRCIDLAEAGIEARDGDLVIVQRTREQGSLVETTAKRMARKAGKTVLMPDSSDPRWQEPIEVGGQSGDEIRVVAKVVFKYLAA